MNRGKRSSADRLFWAFALFLCSGICSSICHAEDQHTGDELERFFETEVRPTLVSKCGGCHSASRQEGGLRTDSRQALIQGGDRGAAIQPGDAAASLLLRAVRHSGDLAMPPDETLSKSTIASLQRWIEMGAAWPASDPHSVASDDAAKKHWAFQEIKKPNVPTVASEQVIRNPVDAFVFAKLSEQRLHFSEPTDRRTLIRRVTYSLTGLPPTPAEVDRFVSNDDPQAYEHLVVRLLGSEHYGEHWARHWLDVARYSDTKGYVYAREERFWTHAWAYRDWVARSLNDDMPYDRFLLLQLAADQIEDCEKGDLAAMGFLTLGRRFLGVKREIIDDRIDVVCRGTMGLTVACARCHNHKYDPIPTADYYSLYGVFASCAERLVSLQPSHSDAAFSKEIAKGEEALTSKLAASRAEASKRARDRTADYLFAQSELHKYPANGFDQIFEEDDLLPAVVRRWECYLRDANRKGDSLFTAWHRYADLAVDSFASSATEVTKQLTENDEFHPRIGSFFQEPPKSFQDVCDRYGQALASVASDEDKDPDPVHEVLHGPNAPSEVPDLPITEIETYFDSATCTALWKLQGEVDRLIINSTIEAPYALTLHDQAKPIEPRIFRRGNPLTPGDDVPRQFLSLLAGEQRTPFQKGSGRLELAQAIVDPSNPLTARVIVNRVWSQHFGHGLVSTPSDFGIRAAPPSHPELLDWLTATFVEEGWSLKKLHRRILLSTTYRQSSKGPSEREKREAAIKIDPDNRLLWRASPRRMSFEEFRDSLLAVTKELDRSIGGKPAKLFEQPFPKRRTLYGLVDRQYLPGTLRVFDFANPDLHVPKRSETTVPQQALFFMNHPLVLERSKSLAKIAQGSSSERVETLFRQVFQRRPTDRETADALALVAATEQHTNIRERVTAADWQYGYGAVDETDKSISSFTPLPHFTGQAWQGGAKWPDSKLGWAQLTAGGGHPGNDRQHAAIRRWTAPRDMHVGIKSELNHEPSQGDGIRAFVVSPRGVHHAVSIHQDMEDLDVETLQVSIGDTIDFLVDIGDVLNSDQYLWTVEIKELTNDESLVTWNSVADFPAARVERLTPWQQLAQVLLCSNEFMFID